MTDPNLYLILATEGLVGVAIVTLAGLAGWRGWLALKAQQFAVGDADHAPSREPSLPNASARIEIADLKERIRKLEAIAAGVDL
ncbi:hypothetical protein [Sphingomonas japonica]|uniref:Phage shock protein B n=1 Tax=Sphingomonas japonica TaxID=511662 RepID=A0ABX0U2F9_9SPHN|nr:hypothetical protein [Sphingomonas japonica]NIJ24740.1 hypothetical protein [Sphingomonas japonica]